MCDSIDTTWRTCWLARRWGPPWLSPSSSKPLPAPLAPAPAAWWARIAWRRRQRRASSRQRQQATCPWGQGQKRRRHERAASAHACTAPVGLLNCLHVCACKAERKLRGPCAVKMSGCAIMCRGAGCLPACWLAAWPAGSAVVDDVCGVRLRCSSSQGEKRRGRQRRPAVGVQLPQNTRNAPAVHQLFAAPGRSGRPQRYRCSCWNDIRRLAAARRQARARSCPA